MKSAAVNSVRVLVMWVVVALVVVAGAGVARAAVAIRDVAAEGSADRLWVAEVVKADDLAAEASERTRVYTVAVPENGWQPPMQIGAGVRDLTHRGTQLVAALKTGEWMFIWPDGRSTGPVLPAGGEIVGMGTDGTTVWAVGRVAGGMKSVEAARRAASRPSATEPATREVAGTTMPATTQAAEVASVTTAPAVGPPKLVLFHLDRSTWVGEGELPEEVPAGVDRVSVAVVRGRVYAGAVVGGAMGIYRKEGGERGGWRVVGRLKPEQVAAVTEGKVMDSGGERPVAWVAGATGAGYLYYEGAKGQWGKPTELRVEADLSQPLPRDVAVAAERVRLVFAKGGKLHVQSYDARTGEPKGKVATVVAGTAGADSKVGMWINAAVMAVLVAVMFGAIRRRGEIEETVRRLDRIPLAPLGLRFAAGFVDMWPFWAAGIYLQMRIHAAEDVETWMWDSTIVRFNAVAFAVYIVHTLVLEMLAGASIGKMLFGLRVVRLDGGRAGAGSMFIRNVMRAVDVGLLFVGAVMIVMSPLRQRIGDLAAGTIVVRKTAVGQEAGTEEEAGVGGE